MIEKKDTMSPSDTMKLLFVPRRGTTIPVLHETTLPEPEPYKCINTLTCVPKLWSVHTCVYFIYRRKRVMFQEHTNISTKENQLHVKI